MDWAYAIDHNRTALIRIIAGLAAIAELAAERLPRTIHAAIIRILRPAESAVRRLIIVAAHGLTPEPYDPRPKSPKKKSSAKRAAPAAFQLFDPRKRFAHMRRRYCPESRAPRVWSIGYDTDPLVPWFVRPGYVPPEPPPPKDTSLSTQSLRRRIEAAAKALEDIPHQAKRLVRWQARRARRTDPTFTDPMRPGWPPGRRKRPKLEIDQILIDCHSLALERGRSDSS